MTKAKQSYNRLKSVSPARLTDDGLIELARISNMKRTGNRIFEKAREEDSILTNVPKDTNFFYRILKFTKNDEILFSEKGIGELTKSDGRTILTREHVFKSWDTDRKVEFETRNPTPQDLSIDGWFVVTTYMPTHYSQLFTTEHSVLCSIDSQTPSIVPLEEATLLGRLDGRIQSIDSDELLFILGDNIKRGIENATGNLHLQVKEIDLKAHNNIIMTDQIQLKPKKQRPRRFSVGSLYYNEKYKTYEFHDGEKWRKLVTE